MLREEGGFFVFTSNYSFSSPSAAAATVIGASANGRISWKLPDGRTYADWEENQNIEEDTSSETLGKQSGLTPITLTTGTI